MGKYFVLSIFAGIALMPVVCGAESKKAAKHLPQLPVIEAKDILKKNAAPKEIPRKNFKKTRHMANYGAVVQRCWNAAVSYLRQASEYTEISNTADAVYDARVNFPHEGYDYNKCGGSTLAYAYPGGNIYLCAVLLDNGDPDAIIQTIIHEGAHVAGYRNECTATKIEVVTMRTAGGGLAYRNDYMNPCGIQ